MDYDVSMNDDDQGFVAYITVPLLLLLFLPKYMAIIIQTSNDSLFH